MLKCTHCKKTLDPEFKKMTWHQFHSLMRGDYAVILCPHCEEKVCFCISIEVHVTEQLKQNCKVITPGTQKQG